MRIQSVYSIALVTTLCLGVSMAAHGQSAACPTRPGDRAAVIDTLRGMYAAATVNDVPKFNSLLAPGFYMYDGGNRYDSDAIMKTMEQLYAKGYVYVWSVTQPDVHVSCDHAWIAYVNQGSYRIKGGPIQPTTWLESAELDRIGDAWKLVFFQSTRVPDPTPPAAH